MCSLASSFFFYISVQPVHCLIIYTAVNMINICKFCRRLSKQHAILLALLFTMCGLTVFGFGICVALVLIVCQRQITGLCKCAICVGTTSVIPYITCSDKATVKKGSAHWQVLGDLSNKTKICAQPRKRISNPHEGDSSHPPKRGRKKSPCKDSHRFGSCTIWLQTGGISELEKYHDMKHPKHPNEKACVVTSYASVNGKYPINLRPENCLCNSCHRDSLRGIGEPRWLKLKRRVVSRHCMLCCCEGSCSCIDISDWSGCRWYEENS